MEAIRDYKTKELFTLIKQKLTSETGLWSALNKFDRAADYCVIISASDMYSRAITKTVWIADVEDQQALAASLSQAIEVKLIEMAKKLDEPLVTCRIEWMINSQLTTWSEFTNSLKKFKRNYYRSGIAFKGIREPWLLLTEMELNANACLYKGGQTSHAAVNDNNFSRYFKRRHGSSQIPNYTPDLEMLTFNTAGWFFDIRTSECWDINTQPRNKGRRLIRGLQPNSTLNIVTKSSQYLAEQVQTSGKYIYGYFPCFDRKIDFYNNLRHASSTYALIEGFEVCRDKQTLNANELAKLKTRIDHALTYMRDKLIRDYGDVAYVIDLNDEIKLGANAVAILAFVKYLQVFSNTEHRDEYLAITEKLASGIVAMQQKDGSFVHVLHADSLKLKQKTRIIYYDGEAAFGLMRLYGLTKDDRWLDCVVRAFDHFIDAKHYHAHDHWLSYCSNELVIYKPDKKYFQFAVNNVKGYTDFIKNRITTFPTLLELSMAFHKMLIKLDDYPEYHDVLKGFDIAEFYEALHARANYLLNGFFFPEVAMFFKSPNSIEHGFFIRHHGFRVRIDDVEHYLSGYVNYYALLANPKYPKLLTEATSLKAPATAPVPITQAPEKIDDICTVAWGGDVNLGRRQHFLTAEYGADNVLDIAVLKEADYTIVNLECVLSVQGEQGRQKGEGGPFYYRARPEMVAVLLKAGVDAVTCANNHSGDYGTAALIEQAEILRAVGIDSVGVGESREAAFAPIYHTLPNGVQLALFNVDATMKRYAVASSSVVNGKPTASAKATVNGIAEISAGAAYINPKDHDQWLQTYQPLFEREKSSGRLVLIAIHWGANERSVPDKNEIAIGHQLIEAGADAILGASAHRLQGIELYKGKPIIHDAGDLLFDAMVADPKDGGIFELQISQQGIEAVLMHPVAVDYGRTEPIKGKEAIASCQSFAQLCKAMKTPVQIYEEGCLAVLTPNEASQIKHNLSIQPSTEMSDIHHRKHANKGQLDFTLWDAKSRSDLRVDEVPAEARIDPIEFGPMRLIGLRTKPRFFNRRRMLWVESFWEIAETVSEDYRIHFRGKPTFATTMLAWGRGTSHDPCDWLMPTSTWEVGKIYRDFYGLRPPYLKTWDNGVLQLEVAIRGAGLNTPFKSLPFHYTLHINDIKYAASLPEHLKYRQAFADKVYDRHTVGTWNAEQLQSITRGKWLKPPPKGWYIDAVVNSQKHIDEFSGQQVLMVANTNENRAQHENSTKRPLPFDRHDQIQPNVAKLAGAIVERPIEGLPDDFPVLLVKDPIKAWIEIGIAARTRFDKPVVAVTGTVGKSSTCDMLEHMMVDSKVLTSFDNYNSRVGALGVLASLAPDHDAAIIEVAQSALWMKRGPVTQFIQPDVALVTEIGYSQTQQLSSLEQTMKYKAQIFNGLSRNAIAVVGAHLPFFEQVLDYAKKYSKSVVIYGDHPQSQLRIKDIELSLESSLVRLETDEGDFEFVLPMPSIGMAKNAIAAFAVIHALGFDKQAACRAIERYETTKGRLQLEKLSYKQGVVNIIDDSFNAEYDSMVNAFTIFKSQAFKEADTKGADASTTTNTTSVNGDQVSRYNKKIFVLGRIVHLGDKAKDIHEALAEPLLQSGPDLVLTHGDEMKWLRAKLPDTILGPHFDHAQALAEFLKQQVSPNDVVLFKGSSRDSDFGKTGAIFKKMLLP